MGTQCTVVPCILYPILISYHRSITPTPYHTTVPSYNHSTTNLLPHWSWARACWGWLNRLMQWNAQKAKSASDGRATTKTKLPPIILFPKIPSQLFLEINHPKIIILIHNKFKGRPPVTMNLNFFSCWTSENWS